MRPLFQFAPWIVSACSGLGQGDGFGPLQLEGAAPPEDEAAVDSDTGGLDTGGGDEVPVEECVRYIAPPSGPSGLTSESFSVRAVEDGVERSTCLVIEDLDGDGWPDIFTTGRMHAEKGAAYGIHVLWGGEGGPIEQRWVVPDRMDTCTATDLDGDGDFDILGGHIEGLWALDNLGDRSWAVRKKVVPLDDGAQWFLDSVARFDIDGVPPLDLLVGTSGHLTEECISASDDPGEADVRVFGEMISGRVQCFVGEEDGGFSPAPDGLCPDSLAEIQATNPYTFNLADFDDDNRADLFLGNDFSENFFLRSVPGGGLLDATAESGLGAYDHAMGAVVADLDGDGLRDIYVSDVGPDGLFIADGCTSWYDAAFVRGVAEGTDRTVTWGTAGHDFDLDGDIDLMVTLSLEVGDGGFAAPLCAFDSLGLPDSPTILLVNDGAGHFERVDLPPPDGGGLSDWYYVRLATSDLDRDGDVDAVTLSEARGMRIHTNETPAGGGWLSIRPLQDGSPVIGARVIVHQGDGERMQDLYGTHGSGGHSELRAHFGLGAEAGPVDVSVRWPDGVVSLWEDVAINQVLDLER